MLMLNATIMTGMILGRDVSDKCSPFCGADRLCRQKVVTPLDGDNGASD